MRSAHNIAGMHMLLKVVLVFRAAVATTALQRENALYMQLKTGTVVIGMLPELAPKHVARITELTR